MSDAVDCGLPSNEDMVREHAQTIRVQIERLCQLRSGWDGADALSVSPAAAEAAERLAFKVTCPECLPPTLSATRAGNVLVDWTWADEHVEVEVFADGAIEGHVRVGAIDGEFRSTANNEHTLQWLAHQVTGVGIARLTSPI